ncbi:MAG: MarR family winged helix-turn-helix transcriptional regulator [Anaerolineae bacterium]
MTPTEKTADQFLVLAQRFVRLRPKLAFPDENMAALKRQIQLLRETSKTSHEDRAFLFRIPLLLMQRETPPTMSELSAELGIPMSSATRLADWLVRAKVVERSNDPHDRRVVRLQITDHGRELIRIGTDYMKARIVQILGHFTADEQQQLLRLTTKLIDSIEAEK